ncbi:hypothetical protein [Winogradskyella sp. PC D3.3]
MKSKGVNTSKKQFFITIYKDLLHLENAVELLQVADKTKLELSILGTLIIEDSNAIALRKTVLKSIKGFCKSLLGHKASFGGFYNSELGVTFISGTLTSTFLHDVGGKPLAVLSTGLYEIFRALGSSEKDASQYLNALRTGQYLLIVRGLEDDINTVKRIISSQI